MAGNAAGIAKANAAKAAKRAALAEIAARREALKNAPKPPEAAPAEFIPANEATTANDGQRAATSERSGVVAESLPFVGFVEPVENSTGVGNPTHQGLRALLPVSLDVVERVISGRIRGSTATRAQLALRVVEMNAEAEREAQRAGEVADSPLIAKLAAALGARAPRAPVTVDQAPASAPDLDPKP